MARLNFLGGLYRHKYLTAILLFVALIAGATVIPDDTTIVGDLTVQTTNGIDINPGSDTDADLLSIGVTGSPKVKWDESEDAFQFIEKLLLGTNASLSKTINGSSYASKMALDTDTTTDSGGISIMRHGTSDPANGVLQFYRSRGTHGSESIVQDDDVISSIVGFGFDGTDYEPAASIIMSSDGTPGSNDMPGRIDFKTVADGSRVLNQVMRIGENTDVMIGTTTSDASSILEVQSVSRGSRPAPRMSQTERNNIVSPATGLMVFNTDFATYDIYNGSAWVSFLDNTTAQEFSGKTVTDSLKFKETGGGSNYTAFQAPASLTGDVTFTLPDGDGANGQALKTDGSGNLSWGAAGGGASGVTYHSDFDCDDDTKVSTYDDGASTPTDGTGGTVNYASVSSETSSPLSGAASYKLSKSANNAQGEGWAIDSDSLDYLESTTGQTVAISFNYKTSANFVAGDVFVYVYRVGSNTLEALNMIQGSSMTNSLPAASGGGLYVGWITGNSSDTSFRLIFHQASTNANAVDILIDRLTMGPSSKVQTGIVTSPVRYTPTFTGFGTVSGVEIYSWREGKNLRISGKFTTGTTTAVEARMSLGFNGSDGGLTSDAIPSIRVAGQGYFSVATAAVVTNLIEPSVSYITFGVQNASSAGFSKANGSGFSSSVTLGIDATVPISGWTSGNVMSTGELSVRTQLVDARNSSGQSITTATSTAITGWTEVGDDGGTFDASTGIFTAPYTGKFSSSFTWFFDSTMTGRTLGAIVHYQSDGTTEIRRYSGFAGVASSYSASSISKIIKMNKGEKLKFEVTQNEGSNRTLLNDGTYNTLTIFAEPDLTIVGLAGVNELLSSSNTTLSSYSITASQWGDLTSKQVSQGTWDVEIQVTFYSSGATTTTNVWAGLGTTSGNTSPGSVISDYVGQIKTTTNGSVNTVTFLKKGLSLTSTTTYYLKALAESSTTNLLVAYKIDFRRVQ